MSDLFGKRKSNRLGISGWKEMFEKVEFTHMHTCLSRVWGLGTCHMYAGQRSKDSYQESALPFHLSTGSWDQTQLSRAAQQVPEPIGALSHPIIFNWIIKTSHPGTFAFF